MIHIILQTNQKNKTNLLSTAAVIINAPAN